MLPEKCDTQSWGAKNPPNQYISEKKAKMIALNSLCEPGEVIATGRDILSLL